MKRPVITIIGAGNAAEHLGQRLYDCGFPIRQVFSRRIDKAGRLASRWGAAAVNRLEELDDGAELFILAVRDDAIATVAAALSGVAGEQRLAVHISGATPSEVLAPFFPHYGVLYPFQTFTAGQPVDFSEIPVCIFAPDQQDLQQLQQVAGKISDHVFIVDDDQRSILHVAGVFANNFPNHLFQIASEILKDRNLSFDLLRPLILETARKVQTEMPNRVQTGPAIRGDQSTVNRHLRLLERFPDYQKLYHQLTLSINDKLK